MKRDRRLTDDNIDADVQLMTIITLFEANAILMDTIDKLSNGLRSDDNDEERGTKSILPMLVYNKISLLFIFRLE